MALIGCGGRAKRAPAPPPAPPPPSAAAPAATVPDVPIVEPPPLAEDVIDGFEARRYVSEAGQVMRYRLFRPAEYDPARSYPLVVFLHGASGKGDDNVRQLAGGRRSGAPFWTSPEIQERHPAFVLAPQADPRYAPTWVRSWRPSPDPAPDRREPLELAVELIEALAREFSIDRRRVYLTGYSMGAFGTWIGISRHPRLFAGAVPISGGGDPTHVVETEAAVWAFHGGADEVAPARRSREMIEALRSADKRARLTEYPGAGHWIWPRVAEETELPDWLFSLIAPE